MKIKKKLVFKEILNSKGKSVKDIIAIVTYKDGFVVATKNGLYTNVSDLINQSKLS